MVRNEGEGTLLALTLEPGQKAGGGRLHSRSLHALEALTSRTAGCSLRWDINQAVHEGLCSANAHKEKY